MYETNWENFIINVGLATNAKKFLLMEKNITLLMVSLFMRDANNIIRQMKLTIFASK